MRKHLAAAVLALAVAAPALASERDTPPIVYYAGGHHTVEQMAAMQPGQIFAVGRALAAQTLAIMGAPEGADPTHRVAAASPVHERAARSYALEQERALAAAQAAVRDVALPPVTPESLNTPGFMAELRRVAAANALNERRREALQAVRGSLTLPFGGYCGLFNCGD